MYIINRHIEHGWYRIFQSPSKVILLLTFVMPTGGFWCHTLDYSQIFQRSDKVFSSVFSWLYGAYLHTFVIFSVQQLIYDANFAKGTRGWTALTQNFPLLWIYPLIVISVLLNPNFSTAQHPIGTVYGKPSAVTEPQAIWVHPNGVFYCISKPSDANW